MWVLMSISSDDDFRLYTPVEHEYSKNPPGYLFFENVRHANPIKRVRTFHISSVSTIFNVFVATNLPS